MPYVRPAAVIRYHRNGHWHHRVVGRTFGEPVR